MRIRTFVTILLLTAGICVSRATLAQPAKAVPRPATTPASAVVAPAATPTVAAAPAWPIVAPAVVAPVEVAAPVIAATPVTGPAVADQAPTPPTPPMPPAPPAPAQAPKAVKAPPESYGVMGEPSSNMNVRVDVTITDQTGSGAPTKKTVSLTVADGGRGSVRSGVTVPMATTTYVPSAGKDDPTKPITSFSYRDMGLSLDVTSASIRGNYVRLRLAVEYNPVDEKMTGSEAPALSVVTSGPASFARFSQSLDLALENGKPLVVASSSDPVPSRNRTASLEVKATILK